MKLTTPLVLLFAVSLVSGCTTAGQAYASKHPELPPAHLQILRTGKVPDGDAIAGMTREQVQIAMGVEPAQYLKVEGHDAWVYVRKSLSAAPLPAGGGLPTSGETRNKGGSLMDDSQSQSPQSQEPTKTTIYFNGELATHADNVKGGL